MKLLLAEDERELSNALATMLKHSDYKVDTVYDGQTALDFGLENCYDAIILDIMMPQLSGLEVLERLRRHGIKTPILLLTALSQTEDKINGLDKGANDYLTKPFVIGELLARLRAMTRDSNKENEQSIKFGDIELDRVNLVLSGPKSSLRLGSFEYKMIELLMMNCDRAVTEEYLFERIWNSDSKERHETVKAYHLFINKKLCFLSDNVTVEYDVDLGYRLINQKGV